MGKNRQNTRRGAREQAFQILYGCSFNPPADILGLMDAFRNYPHKDGGAADAANGEPSGFAWELVRGVFEKQAALDGLIESYSRNWRLDRVGRVELVLLRLALFELRAENDTPHKVVINEALELCGQFGSPQAKAFVNGVLDAAVKDLACKPA